MKNIINRLTVFTTFCAALALSLTPTPRAGAVAAADTRERQFQFEYKATVKDTPAGAKRLELWIPVPHDATFQKITGLQIDSPAPYKIQTGQHGNRVLHLSVENPPPSGFTVTMRFEMSDATGEYWSRSRKSPDVTMPIGRRSLPRQLRQRVAGAGAWLRRPGS